MNGVNWGNILGSLGSTGAVLLVVYLLVDRWAGKFLEAMQKQGEAMMHLVAPVATLAEAVREQRDDQREVLIAVKVLASASERQERYLQAIDAKLNERAK